MRNNEQRLESLHNLQDLQSSQVKTTKELEFVVPTEFVDLPSKGRLYPEDHPYFNKESIEIYFATAKENDILTSQSLIEKGLVFDKLIESVLVKKVDARKLLECDRKAILIQVRKSGFSPTYETSTNCNKCGNITGISVDLENQVQVFENLENLENVEFSKDKTFFLELPRTKIRVEVRFLNGEDDNVLFENNKKRKKNKKPERYFTDRLKQLVVSVNGNSSPVYIADFCNWVSLLEAKYIVETYNKICPKITINSTFNCECGNDGTVEVPINVDFFWPNE